jgi:hypothetical protein
MSRIAYLAAPVLIAAYGVVRLIDGLDGSHGPGPAWTIGHVLFGIGLLLFVPVLLGLRGALDRGRALGTAAVVLGVLGLVAFVRTVVIDVLAGVGSVDRAAMSVKYARYNGFPGGLSDSANDILAAVGPSLFGVGLLILLIQHTVQRRLAWWSPVLGVAGFIVMSASLDLLSLGALSLLIALVPARGYRMAASTPSST